MAEPGGRNDSQLEFSMRLFPPFLCALDKVTQKKGRSERQLLHISSREKNELSDT